MPARRPSTENASYDLFNCAYLPVDKRYEEMVALAECLANDFDHLRVDMSDADDSIWVGELTLYSWDGLSPFTPDEADKLIGRIGPFSGPRGLSMRCCRDGDKFPTPRLPAIWLC